MNDRTPRRRRTIAVRGGIALAAATLIVGGVLTLDGHHSSPHAAAPAGAWKGQQADYDYPIPSQAPSQACTDIHNQLIKEDHNVDEKAAEDCATQENAQNMKDQRGMSITCSLVNRQVFFDGVNVFPTGLELQCQKEQIPASPTPSAGPVAPSASPASSLKTDLCHGLEISRGKNENIPAEIGAACPGL